ncbi:MAG: DUF6489 family protein [Pseudomonadota bacterium]
MKLKLEVDLTPKEFREAVGLPDVAGIQKEIIDTVRTKMMEGVDGFDVASMFKSFVSQGMVTAGEMQKIAERFMTMGNNKEK